MKQLLQIQRAALIGAVLFFSLGAGGADEVVHPTKPSRTKLAKRQVKAPPANTDVQEASSEATAAPQGAHSNGSELLVAFGTQLGQGLSLVGANVSYRLREMLSVKIRPVLDVGFFANFQQTYINVPVTLGATRSFPISGLLGDKSEFITGASAGFLFTNEPARDNDFMLLGLVGWEVKVETFNPFIHVEAGIRNGRLIVFPRIGLALNI